MLTEFENRVAVVTGAASGIGAALCAGFAELGMRVMCADIDAEGAAATAAKLSGAASAQTDVSVPESVEALADSSFEQFGQVDVLCNNAGVFQPGYTWERSVDDWQWCFGVNVFGIIHGLRSFVPRMLAQDTPGHIVNTASVAAFVTAPASAPYVVSKGAALSLTECLAHDLASVGSKLGASVLTPSAFDTGIAHTASVRPDRFGTDSSDTTSAVVDGLSQMTGVGLAPEAAVGPVIDGIRNNTFLIGTKPSLDEQLASRDAALRERRLPPVSIVD